MFYCFFSESVKPNHPLLVFLARFVKPISRPVDIMFIEHNYKGDPRSSGAEGISSRATLRSAGALVPRLLL